ncbi:hypothetical protein DJ80_11900 [Halorubrum ezzemoulense]|uniref:Uncharacterized protein n=1 Tax=Halorubrum ezzemoulense TaxID=337243 RepID=A0A256IYS4_HALEZ|nr:hypothetical protein DJ80_11900 [Halorubrum ezzemoulense]
MFASQTTTDEARSATGITHRGPLGATARPAAAWRHSSRSVGAALDSRIDSESRLGSTKNGWTVVRSSTSGTAVSTDRSARRRSASMK